jgi:hypothetical protein
MSGTANTAHHMPTLRKEKRTAWAESANPKKDGLRVIHTLRAKSTPPPRYPRAKPSADTKCSLFFGDTPGSRES